MSRQEIHIENPLPDVRAESYRDIILEAETWLGYKLSQGALEYPGSWQVPEIGGFDLKDEVKPRRVDIVNDVIARRRAELQRVGLTPAKEYSGRVLGVLLDFSLTDGAARAMSDGLFDHNNIPATDTWIGYVERDVRSLMDEMSHERKTGERKEIKYTTGVVLSYIPKSLISRAQNGIDVNPEECIFWL